MRPRGWTFNYLVFELIVDLLTLAAATLLLVSTVKGQPANQPITMHVAAPERIDGPWLNTPDGSPITLAGRGKVTIFHSWTFGLVPRQGNDREVRNARSVAFQRTTGRY